MQCGNLNSIDGGVFVKTFSFFLKEPSEAATDKAINWWNLS